MTDNVQAALSSDEQPEKETKSDNTTRSLDDVNNTPTTTRLFGQFKLNGFGFNSPSAGTFGHASSQEKSDDNSSPSTYFTSTLTKLSSPITSGFNSTSVSLTASLAALGANKPLFGTLSTTTPSSFTDLKPSSTNLLESNSSNLHKTNDDEDKDEDDDNKVSLLETVAEYEAKRASTHPVANIQGDTSTGEENEITKFQMTGKLFMYSSEQQQFIERGYGILKINESHDSTDWDRLQARLIMRLDKSFRVILNSPIFPKMTVERVTDRSVRFGAQDESQLRVFVIKASTNDCNNLCRELQLRIELIEQQQPSTSSSNLNTSINSCNTSVSADSDGNNDSSSKRESPSGQRKRSHSKSDSDTSENNKDFSKKSKLVEENQDIKNHTNPSINEDSSLQEETTTNS